MPATAEAHAEHGASASSSAPASVKRSATPVKGGTPSRPMRITAQVVPQMTQEQRIRRAGGRDRAGPVSPAARDRGAAPAAPAGAVPAAGSGGFGASAGFAPFGAWTPRPKLRAFSANAASRSSTRRLTVPSG